MRHPVGGYPYPQERVLADLDNVPVLIVVSKHGGVIHGLNASGVEVSLPRALDHAVYPPGQDGEGEVVEGHVVPAEELVQALYGQLVILRRVLAPRVDHARDILLREPGEGQIGLSFHQEPRYLLDRHLVVVHLVEPPCVSGDLVHAFPEDPLIRHLYFLPARFRI